MKTKSETTKKEKKGTVIESSSPSSVEQCTLQLKKYAFTYNNYIETEIPILEHLLDLYCTHYLFQQEVGEKTGTPHLQGAIWLKDKMRITELYKLDPLLKKLWLKKMNSEVGCIRYCQKEQTSTGDKVYKKGDFTKIIKKNKKFIEETYDKKEANKMLGIKEPTPLKILRDDQLREWQKSIIESMNEEPTDRGINWIYDKKGGLGKTTFTKYLYAKYDVIPFTGGECKDIARALIMLKQNGRDLNEVTTYIFDLPRCAKGHISYKALEGVKGGLLTSPKNDTETLCFNNPHMWIFSNEMPKISEMSFDKWNVWEVIDNKLCKIEIEEEEYEE